MKILGILLIILGTIQIGFFLVFSYYKLTPSIIILLLGFYWIVLGSELRAYKEWAWNNTLLISASLLLIGLLYIPFQYAILSAIVGLLISTCLFIEKKSFQRKKEKNEKSLINKMFTISFTTITSILLLILFEYTIINPLISKTCRNEKTTFLCADRDIFIYYPTHFVKKIACEIKDGYSYQLETPLIINGYICISPLLK